MIASGSRPSRAGSSESRALQALRKKVDRKDEAYAETPKTQEAADAIIKAVLSVKDPIIRVKDRNGQKVKDVYDPISGRGVRTVDGQFDTFVNL